MGRIRGTNLGITLLALTAACGGATPATTGGGGSTASATSSADSTAEAASSATAGVGGTGGMAQATASASVTAGVGGSGGSGGSGDFVCDPVAAPGSIYERTADMFGSAGPSSMCKYRNDVMLIVNTAAI
jgi:hypothetical protein